MFKDFTAPDRKMQAIAGLAALAVVLGLWDFIRRPLCSREPPWVFITTSIFCFIAAVYLIFYKHPQITKVRLKKHEEAVKKLLTYLPGTVSKFFLGLM